MADFKALKAGRIEANKKKMGHTNVVQLPSAAIVATIAQICLSLSLLRILT